MNDIPHTLTHNEQSPTAAHQHLQVMQLEEGWESSLSASSLIMRRFTQGAMPPFIHHRVIHLYHLPRTIKIQTRKPSIKQATRLLSSVVEHYSHNLISGEVGVKSSIPLVAILFSFFLLFLALCLSLPSFSSALEMDILRFWDAVCLQFHPQLDLDSVSGSVSVSGFSLLDSSPHFQNFVMYFGNRM